MTQILENLENENIRKTTKNSYHKIWQRFNKFIIRLDRLPEKWEIRTGLFCAHLIWNENKQSSTIKTYISAIKDTLKKDGYLWDDKIIMLNALTHACKLKNDIVKLRLPISIWLLNNIIFETSRKYHKQPYLSHMYSAIFALFYYGMFRVGELTQSPHVVKAINIHQGRNKNKFMIVLYSSKTHGPESTPQQVKIIGRDVLEVENDNEITLFSRKNILKNKNLFCPAELTQNYINVRPPIIDAEEQLFIFSDRSNLKAYHVRKLLRSILQGMGLDQYNYDTHSFRIGRATDLDKEVSIDKIKQLG